MSQETICMILFTDRCIQNITCTREFVCSHSMDYLFNLDWYWQTLFHPTYILFSLKVASSYTSFIFSVNFIWFALVSHQNFMYTQAFCLLLGVYLNVNICLFLLLINRNFHFLYLTNLYFNQSISAHDNKSLYIYIHPTLFLFIQKSISVYI